MRRLVSQLACLTGKAMDPDGKWVSVVAVGMGVLIIAGLVVWLAWPEYPVACMNPWNYERILREPWPQTRKTLSSEEIADYRADARAMISRVLATGIPGDLICPPAAKHPIRAMDNHFDGCQYLDFQWEGDVLSCRPLYWYEKDLSPRHGIYYGQVDSVVKVDFRKSPEAVIYSDRFVEIKVSEEWYPYNGVLRIPTPNAKAARRLLDAFEVMGAIPVQRWPLQPPAARDPRVTKRGRMALERIYMALRKGKFSRIDGKGLSITAETISFRDDYTLVLGSMRKARGVTITGYLPEVDIDSVEVAGGGSDDQSLVMTGKVRDEGRTRPSTRNVVMTAREVRIQPIGRHLEFDYIDVETRFRHSIVRQRSFPLRIPLPKFDPDQHTPEGGK